MARTMAGILGVCSQAKASGTHAAAAVNVSLAQRRAVRKVIASYNAAPGAGANLQASWKQEGATKTWRVSALGAFAKPLILNFDEGVMLADDGTTLAITLSDGGVGVVGYVSVIYR